MLAVRVIGTKKWSPRRPVVTSTRSFTDSERYLSKSCLSEELYTRRSGWRWTPRLPHLHPTCDNSTFVSESGLPRYSNPVVAGSRNIGRTLLISQAKILLLQFSKPVVPQTTNTSTAIRITVHKNVTQCKNRRGLRLGA